VVLCGAVWCSVVQCVAVCCSVLQCVAVCCSVLQRVKYSIRMHHACMCFELEVLYECLCVCDVCTCLVYDMCMICA